MRLRSKSGKMSCINRSKNFRYVIRVNRSGKRTLPISRSAKIPAQTLGMWSDVWPLELRVGLACAQICTLWKLQIPIRVNLVSSVNNSFHRNWMPNALFQTPLVKSLMASQILRHKTLYTLQKIWIQLIFV